LQSDLIKSKSDFSWDFLVKFVCEVMVVRKRYFPGFSVRTPVRAFLDFGLVFSICILWFSKILTSKVALESNICVAKGFSEDWITYVSLFPLKRSYSWLCFTLEKNLGFFPPTLTMFGVRVALVPLLFEPAYGP
jgi:hypothetical protein